MRGVESFKISPPPQKKPKLIFFGSQKRPSGRFGEDVISYVYRNSNPGPSSQ